MTTITAGRPMGRPTEPDSRASRILALLRSRPNEPVPTRKIADELGLTISQVTGAIATKRRGPRTDEWQHVVHAHHGAWAYRTDAPAQPLPPLPGWNLLGEQDDAVVLRGPDGKLWVARPL